MLICVPFIWLSVIVFFLVTLLLLCSDVTKEINVHTFHYTWDNY